MAKGTTNRILVFLISDKKRNLQINKNGYFEKKGNFREPVAKFEKIASLYFDKKKHVFISPKRNI